MKPIHYTFLFSFYSGKRFFVEQEMAVFRPAGWFSALLVTSSVNYAVAYADVLPKWTVHHVIYIRR
jgi:hypothetical protein